MSGPKLVAYIIPEREQAPWIRAGACFENSDGSLNVILDVLPKDGRIHLRPPKPKEESKF